MKITALSPVRTTLVPRPDASHGATLALLLLALVLVLVLPACSTLSTPPQAQVIENSLGMKFVRVPAGEFLMGSDESPESLSKAYPQYGVERLTVLTDEAPAHRVRLSQAFFLGQHEVTVGQFRKFLQASGYVPEAVADGTGGYGYNPAYDPATTQRGDAFEGRDPRYSWANPGFAQGENEPVLNVTWNDAVAMSQWLSQTEGKKYRLPTEAEWEYACHACTQTRYASGDDPQSLARVANTFDLDAVTPWPQWTAYALAQHDGYAFTAPVGSFAPNAFGLYDMHGNAWEWVSDRYQEDYYATSPVDDPQGPGPDAGAMRVRRGGSWHTWSLYSRCSFRNINTESSRYPLLGMRLVRELDAQPR